MQDRHAQPQKMDFLIRFGQTHEAFRLAEIRALTSLTGVDMEVVSYRAEVRNWQERERGSSRNPQEARKKKKKRKKKKRKRKKKGVKKS